MSKKQIRPSDLDQIFEVLMDECIHAKTYMAVCRGLLAADPVLLDLAPVFFGYSFFAHFYSAQMHANKLFDANKEAISVYRLMTAAAAHKTGFPHATSEQVVEAIRESEDELGRHKNKIGVLRIRRNNVLAHLSHDQVLKRENVNKISAITPTEVASLLELAVRIINRFDLLWSKGVTVSRLPNDDDFRRVFEMMKKQRIAEIEAHEKEFGPDSIVVFPRPR